MSVNLLDWTVDGGVSLHFAEQELASHHFHPPDFEDDSIPTPRRGSTLPLTRTISVRSTFSDMSQDELAEDKTSINVLVRENRSQFGAALSDACSYDLSRPILDGEEVFLSPAFCVAACKSDFEPATTDFDERMEVEVEPDSSPPSPSPVSPSEIASYLAQSTISSFMPGAPFHLQLDTALNIVTSDRDSTDPHLVESAEWWWVEQEAISEGRPVPTRPARELETLDMVRQACVESSPPRRGSGTSYSLRKLPVKKENKQPKTAAAVHCDELTKLVIRIPARGGPLSMWKLS